MSEQSPVSKALEAILVGTVEAIARNLQIIGAKPRAGDEP